MTPSKKIRRYCVLTGLLLLLYVADALTTSEVNVGPLYLFVVAYGAWNLGKTGGLLTSLVCVGLWATQDIVSGHRYSQPWIIWEQAGVRLTTYFAETFFFSLYRATLEAHRRRLAVMERVLAVCPSCGRIGPQESGWRLAEELRSANGDRYKLCPVCASTHANHAAAHPSRPEVS